MRNFDMTTATGVTEYLNSVTINFNDEGADEEYARLSALARANYISSEVIDRLYARSVAYTDNTPYKDPATNVSEDSNKGETFGTPTTLFEKVVSRFTEDHFGEKVTKELERKSIFSIFEKDEDKKDEKSSEDAADDKNEKLPVLVKSDSDEWTDNKAKDEFEKIARSLFEKIGEKFEQRHIDIINASIAEAVKESGLPLSKLFPKQYAEEAKSAMLVLTAEDIKNFASFMQSGVSAVKNVLKSFFKATKRKDVIDLPAADDDDIYDLPLRMTKEEYTSALDTVQTEIQFMPKYLSRSIAMGILASAELVTTQDIINDIEYANRTLLANVNDAYIEAVNSVTNVFGELGPFIVADPPVAIEEIISKQALVTIASKLVDAVENKYASQVRAVVEKICRYEFKKTDHTENVNPVVFTEKKSYTSNPETAELKPSVVKMIEDAFGELLKNRKYILKKNGEFVNLYLTDAVFNNNYPVFLIDPDIVIGDGVNIYANAMDGSAIYVNIASNRDIVAKILSNPFYLLDANELARAKAGQFKNTNLYSVLDMSGMNKYLKNLNAKDMNLLEAKLDKIFATPNGIFAGFAAVPKFRFQKFKNIDNFTLISDEKVKILFATPNGIANGMRVSVSKLDYTISYMGADLKLNF